MKPRNTIVPVRLCPHCGHRLDAAMATEPGRLDATPEPGDVTVCIACTGVLVFDAALRVRKPEPSDGIDLTDARIRRAQQAVRMAHKALGRRPGDPAGRA